MSGWGLEVVASGVGVSDGRLVIVSDGWIVEVTVGDGLVVLVSSVEVVVSPGWLIPQLRPDDCKNRDIPNASPPKMTRLITERSAIPVGVIRMFHPTRRFRVRGERGEPDESLWLAIIGVYIYFTRCKKCAQLHAFLLFKPDAIQLVVNPSFGEQLVVGSLLNNPAVLDYHNPVGIDYRGKTVSNHEGSPPFQQG